MICFKLIVREITESSAANIFFVKEEEGKKVLETPDLSCGLLAGVTRKNLIASCKKKGFLCVKKDFSKGLKELPSLFS